MGPRVSLLLALSVLFLSGLVFGCASQEDVLTLSNFQDPSATTGTITGQVLSQGQPVGGANIATTPESSTTNTDSRGNYTLEGVPPGTYRVLVSKGDLLEESDKALVLAGQATQRNFEMAPATGSGSLVGQVTDGTFGLDRVLVETVPATVSQITTQDGRFSIPGAPGQYSVQATRLGFFSETKVVQLREGRVTSQDFALGRRSDGVLTGVILDTAGQPIANARVDLLFDGRVFTAFTASNGAYGFFDLVTGFYVLSVTRETFLPGSKTLEIRGGSNANGDIVLVAQTAVPPRPGAVTGTIFDAQDRPVAGIQVSLNVASSPVNVLTGSDGRFVFFGVPPGGATLTAVQAQVAPGGPIFSPQSIQLRVAEARTADGSLNLVET